MRQWTGGRDAIKRVACIGGGGLTIRHIVMRRLLRVPVFGAAEWGVYACLWDTRPASMAALARQARTSRSKMRQVCCTLADHGWVVLDKQGYRVRPTAVVPAVCQTALVESLEQAHSVAPLKGEFLMKAFLDYAVASESYADNARPEFLTNPATGERLEYDRYYFDGVAFEFNGMQHGEATDRFPSTRQLRDTQARDLIKIGRSVDARITLVTVLPHQLHPEIMASLLPDSLPRRVLDLNGPYLRAVARLAVGYAAKAQSQATD